MQSQIENPKSQISPGVLWCDPIAEPGWDEQVGAFNGASIFHTSAWAKVLCDTYGYQPFYAVAHQGHERTAFLPLMEVDSAFTGRRAVSLPFTDECHVLHHDHDTLQPLLSSVLARGKERGWKYIEFRGGEAGEDRGQRTEGGGQRSEIKGQSSEEDGGQRLVSQPSTLNPQPTYYGHRLDLSPGEKGLYAGLGSSVRRALRKSSHSGVQVEIARDLESLKLFYALHCKTRRRHGLPPQPFSFFQNIARHILKAGLGFVSIARHQALPVAAAVFFHFGKNATYKFGASDERFQEVRGNNAVMWAGIRELAARGMRQLDFGRTDINQEGLRRFKLSWGATEYPIHYRRYDLRRDQFVISHQPSTINHQPVSGWHNHAFRAMPLWSLKLAGRLIYRHMA